MKSLLFFYFYISQFAASIECPRRSSVLSPRLDLFSLNRQLECGIGTNERQPWSVTLRMTDGVLCGGALISPNWVLTSADCAERFEDKWGSVFLERIDNGLLLGPSREQCVVKIEIHPSRTADSRESNIALLKLNTARAHFGALSSSVCVPDRPAEKNLGQLHMHRNCLVTSWTKALPETPTQLTPKHRAIQTHRRPRCESFKTEGLICASGKGFGVCKGSNGAVLSCENPDGKWTVYGVGGLVMDNDCSERSQVSEFTDIARHSDWIKATMEEVRVPAANTIYGEWESWTECTEVCNGGTQLRRRRCRTDGYCRNDEIEQRPCSTFPCETLFGFRRQVVDDEVVEPKSVCFHDHVEERATARVVGGDATNAEEWPFMAVFYSKKGGWSSRFCGGSLLNERWVLSAAHCFMDPYSQEIFNFKKYAVGFGNFQGATFPGQYSTIKSINCHKGFKATYDKISDDICLVELNTPVQFTETVKPVCISKQQPEEGDYCKIAGAGQTLGTSSDETLNEASIPVANFDQCYREYIDFGINLESQQHLCAGFDSGGVDACQGDSGGPFYCDNSYLSGVVSFGIGCASADTFGIYTAVSAYIGWIGDTMGIAPLRTGQKSCPKGFKGESCSEDIDECSSASPCDYNQKCINTVGSYVCVKLDCENGYEAIDGECVDIDECAMNACGYTLCRNLPGSFECICQDGYELVNGRCLDIDECERDSLCAMGEICTNRLGGFFCQKEENKVENKMSWTSRCDPPRQLYRSEYVCDADTCVLQCESGSSMSRCINDGKRTCTCLGNRCFWSSIGRECECKEDSFTDGFMLGPMSDTGGTQPQMEMNNRLENNAALSCPYNSIKKKCKTKSNLTEYLSGEICAGKCNKKGKSNKCTCLCTDSSCKWKCKKSKC